MLNYSIGNMLRQSFQAFKSKQLFVPLRWIAAVPATGKKPPTLEEFDPLNPGEWQLGVIIFFYLNKFYFLFKIVF